MKYPNEIPATQKTPFVSPHIVSTLGDRGSAKTNAVKVVDVSGQATQEFERIAREMMAWLNDNYHPHVTVIITPTHTELSVGEMAFQTFDYVKD